MSELLGLSLSQHLDNIFREVESLGSIYGYPLKKVFYPDPTLDLSVQFHGQRAATPLGPASGPHTQMAQNIVLAFLGGSRIMELKTVQILDELDIPRPCIDARNVCFNVEWSQEMKLGDSLHEYVTAWILLKLLAHMDVLEAPPGDGFYDFVFDLSVGYDLKGISSPEVTGWIRQMMNAEDMIQASLAALPERYGHLRHVEIPACISKSLTLSTFHGCPRDEIEKIVAYLLEVCHLDVLIKMNPTQPGHDAVHKMLHGDMGYGHLELDPTSFEQDLKFDEAVAMMGRLEAFAKERGLRAGAKFTNTLVVKNAESVFTDDVMYLSGRPLHVLAMSAMLPFRQAVGAHIPISFSGGIDRTNFVDTVASGLCPVTTCTDLLVKGGYVRQVKYLKALEKAIRAADCTTVDGYICHRAGMVDGSAEKASLVNAESIVPALVDNVYYHNERNLKTPKKVGTHLHLLDCLTCNICLPVCPNAANFSLPLGKQTTTYRGLSWTGTALELGDEVTFELTKKAQIANLADFCNECGNCDTFCPEDGGPYLEKPRFFYNRKSYETFHGIDGFCLQGANTLIGRIKSVAFEYAWEPEEKRHTFTSPLAICVFDDQLNLISANPRVALSQGQQVDLYPFHVMRVLFEGLSGSNDFPAVILRGAAHESN